MSSKNKLLVLSGAVAVGLTGTPAFAEGGYAGGFVGAISPADFDINEADELSADSGIVFGGVVGRQFGERLRGEIEGSYWSADADCSGKCGDVEYDADALSILGNVWVDFGDASGFSPYIGGGVGAASVSLESSSGDADAWGLAYQVGFGARFDAQGAIFDLGYRYRGVNADLDDHPLVSKDIEISGQSLQLGAVFTF